MSGGDRGDRGGRLDRGEGLCRGAEHRRMGEAEAALMDLGFSRLLVARLAFLGIGLAEGAPQRGCSLHAAHAQHDGMGQRLKDSERDRKQRNRQRDGAQTGHGLA